MTEREFCYWLQGVLEVGGVQPLDERQVQIINDHLQLVFSKATPARPVEDNKTRVTPGVNDLWRHFQQTPPSPLGPSMVIC